MDPNRTPSDGSANAVFGIALAVALAIFGVGVYLAVTTKQTFLLSDGIFATLIVAVTWPLASGMAAWRCSAEGERANMLKAVDQRLAHMAELLTTLSQQQLLSDRAKSVAYRNKDRQALRDAIREEMNAKDWDAALVLANDMEREFGYTQEAAALRADINNNRAEVIRRQVGEAIGAVDQHVAAEQWTQAVREAERVMQLYPNDPHAQALPEKIEQRRQQHKRALRESMDAAAARHDYDGALETLRRLDPYLTPAEAGGMQEMVRGLLRDRINSFKDQFIKAVHEERFADAVRIGEVVKSEHPNSRIALEITDDLLVSLRQRAAGQGSLQPQPA